MPPGISPTWWAGRDAPLDAVLASEFRQPSLGMEASGREISDLSLAYISVWVGTGSEISVGFCG